MLRELLAQPGASALVFYVGLSIVLALAEVVVGILSSSLGLLCDGIHGAMHASGLIFSLMAVKLSREPPNLQFTYGMERVEVLSAFANAVLLLFLSLFVVVEGIRRLWEPVDIHTHHVIPLALLGLVANGAGAIVISRHVKSHRGLLRRARDANVDAVLLHATADVLSSLGVLVSTILVRWMEWHALDPITGLLILWFVLQGVLPLLASTGRILLQAAPCDVVSAAIEEALLEVSSLDGILKCRRERIWTMSPGKHVCTLVFTVGAEADQQGILVEARRKLSPLIAHLTVQIERERSRSGDFGEVWARGVRDTPVAAREEAKGLGGEGRGGATDSPLAQI